LLRYFSCNIVRLKIVELLRRHEYPDLATRGNRIRFLNALVGIRNFFKILEALQIVFD